MRKNLTSPWLHPQVNIAEVRGVQWFISQVSFSRAAGWGLQQGKSRLWHKHWFIFISPPLPFPFHKAALSLGNAIWKRQVLKHKTENLPQASSSPHADSLEGSRRQHSHDSRESLKAFSKKSRWKTHSRGFFRAMVAVLPEVPTFPLGYCTWEGGQHRDKNCKNTALVFYNKIRLGEISDLDELVEKAMAPHSSTPAWKIPWTEENGRLQSTGLQRVRHDWATSLSLFIFKHWRRKWHPTPVFLPGESQGQGSLVGSHSWDRIVDTTEATWQRRLS